MSRRLVLFVAAFGLSASACGSGGGFNGGMSPAGPIQSSHGTSVPTAVLGAETKDLPTTPQIVAAVGDSVGTIKWPNTPDPGKWDGRCVAEKPAESCSNGDPNGSKTILIYGDSYAEMWTPAIKILAMETGRKAELISLGACPVPDFPAWSYRNKRRNTECDAFRGTAVEHVHEVRPELVVIASAYQGIAMERNGQPTRDGLDEAWVAGLNTMIGRLKDAGAGRVVVMGDVANSKGEPLDCLTSHPDNVPLCNTPRALAVVTEHNRTEMEAAQADGGTYVDPVPWLCTGDVCPEVIAGLTVRKDRRHLSLNYTLWLRKALGEAIGL